MEPIFSIIRVIHIVAGGLALFSGLLAMGLFNKAKFHRKVGKVFFWNMLIVFVTAVVLSVYVSTPFLFAIAVFSFFATFHGVRSMQFFKGASPRFIDGLAVVVLSMIGVFLFGRGVYYGLSSFGFSVILHLVFGLAMMVLAFVSGNDLVQLNPRDRGWFRSHQSAMGGALIATITAFCTTALDFLPPLVAWLGPSLILSPILSIIIRKSNPFRSKA